LSKCNERAREKLVSRKVAENAKKSISRQREKDA